MDRLERAALLTELVKDMRESGSWSSETHIQKAGFVLQVLFGVPTDFNFILYKHGPFSFDLREELTSMLADGLIEQKPQPPYGPMFEPTEASRSLRQSFGELVNRYEKALRLVSSRLGPLDIFHLEQLATAVYVVVEERLASDEAAARLIEIKPHVGPEGAAWAVKEASELVKLSGKAGAAV
jgi:hypothetical protein